MTRPSLLALLGALFFLGAGHADAAEFTFCQGKYALCTTALCTPVPGKEGIVSCACAVKSGYSAGRANCAAARQTAKGEYVQSRYYPVKSLAVCNNDRPWANCLGKACFVDKNDPTKATCSCTTVKDQRPYVFVGDSFTPKTCTTGIISSATLADNKRISAFLEGTKLKPFHVEILNPAASERRLEPTSGKDAE